MGTIMIRRIHSMYGLGVYSISKYSNSLFDIESNIYYARDYSDVPGATHIIWWVSKQDYSLICQQELMSQYGYKTRTEIEETGRFLPFARVNIILLERDYCREYYPKHIRKLASDNPDTAFKRLVEQQNDIAHWHSFEKNALKAAVIQWCKVNGVPYF